MKTAQDPRHKRRQKLVKNLFSYSFHSEQAFPKNLKPIQPHLVKIDKLIGLATPQFPPEKLNKIDLAILRLAVFELMIERNVPVKVIIDEAVELGKEFGSDKSPKFINGVLGTLIKKHD